MKEMEPPKIEPPKLPDMVMCGDHPSFTKKELNAKEVKDEKEKNKTSFARISPSSSRTGTPVSGATLPGLAGAGAGAGAAAGGGAGERTRSSEHAMRLIDARRRVRSLEQVPRSDVEAVTGNRGLVQAALGSFRWPPYLLAVWVLVLILTHALHCLVSVMERALPNLKRFCQYFRTWTEDSWKEEADINHRLYPIALALMTGLLYSLYFGLFVLYSVALWSIEPLCTDIEEKQSSVDVMETKVTNYVDEISSKTNIKH